MGKANRNKRDDQEKLALAAQRKEQAAAAAKKSVRNKFIAIVCTILAVVLLATPIVYSKLITSGYFLRRTVSVTTENFEVDNAVVSYFLHEYYQQFISTYATSLSYFGLNTQATLKSQQCLMLQNGSWFDYFLDTTRNTLKNLLAFCEEAKARGLTLDDEDYAEIDAALESVKKNAKDAGYSTSFYIRSMFGTGVNEKDLRRALEISALAAKCREEIVGAYNYDSADYQKYVEENPKALLDVDYISFTMTTSDGTVAEDVNAEIIENYATQLSGAASAEKFEDIVYDYLRNNAYKSDTDKTDDEIREEIENLTSTDVTYKEDDEFSEWAFSSERKAGDTYRMDDEENSQWTVYFLIKPAALEEYNTVNIRHILLNTDSFESEEAAKARAEELLAQWTSGAATAESFAEMANEYSEDEGSNTNGGLYENVAQGDMVDAFDAWLFEEGRKAGDSGIVQSEFGYHIMYLDSFGMKAWEVQADSALKNAQYSADSAALLEKYPVTFDTDALYKIDA